LSRIIERHACRDRLHPIRLHDNELGHPAKTHPRHHPVTGRKPGHARATAGRGRVVVLEAGRATLELLDHAQAEVVDAIEAGRRAAGKVRLALEVADSEATARELAGAGGEQVAPPVLTPWGDRNARVQAPDGMQLTLFTTE
jgi:uncharacterized glyoxalase superfamily protein PhnB